MRLVRLGAETSQVGKDVRAALAAWGESGTVLGGIALLGVTPTGGSQAVEAIVVVPRGVIVVVSVDLPDPAMRLDAPLHDQWKTDGWPLVREDGAVNPASEALAAAASVVSRLQHGRFEPMPVGTVVAVGPYVSQVVQPTVDLHRGVRVLHPRPMPLLTAFRELAVYERPCSVDNAKALVRAIAGDQVTVSTAQLAAEGFPDAVSTDLAAASTTLIPRFTERPADQKKGAKPAGERRTVRWLPIGALALLGALLIAGIGVAVASSGGGSPTRTAATSPPQVDDVTVGGVRFTPKGSTEGQDCANRSYGDLQVWLQKHQCANLTRSLYETSVNGQSVAVAQAVVAFADKATAQAFAQQADTPGSGGITDLVKDGQGWAGGPKSFDGAAYSVTPQGSSVRIIEVAWIGKASNPNDPQLRSVAALAVGLPVVP